MNALIVRRMEPRDAGGMARMMADPGVYAGLMQLPYASEPQWAARLSTPATDGSFELLLVAERGDVLVGSLGAWAAEIQVRVAAARGLRLGAARSPGRAPWQAAQRRMGPLAAATRRAEAIQGAGRCCALVVWGHHTPRARLARHPDSPRRGPEFLPPRLLGLHPVPSHVRRRHVALLGISVVPAAQRQGVGTALMQAALDYADRWAGILRVELDVYNDNAPAIALYLEFGFQVEGTHRAFALRDGRYVDSLSMARLHPAPPALPT